jgi:hypothetical protein
MKTTTKALFKFLARLFESNYTYNDAHTVRVHKRTGDVEYLWMDGMGNYWESEPMFDDGYSYVPRKPHLKAV